MITINELEVIDKYHTSKFFWNVRNYQMKLYSTFIPTSLQKSIIYDFEFSKEILLYMIWALKWDLDGRKQDYKSPKNGCLSFEMNPP